MIMPRARVDVGILGATGMVGQQFVARLAGHPWFRPAWLAASERSSGRRYRELPWRLPVPLPESVADLVVDDPDPSRAPHLVFSALDASVAGEIETAFAASGRLVVSNARNHRMDPLVPLLVPEINADHLQLLALQRRDRGWTGALVTNPNCSTVFLAMVLAALEPFAPRRVIVTTLQAASGAGHPGVASLDLLGNVVPFIGGEEEKIETETRKILGTAGDRGVEARDLAISATSTRVPVVHGHTESISIGFERAPASADAILSALEAFTGPPQERALPSAPARPIVCLPAQDRPQPARDVDAGDGMTVTVGRVRPCGVLDYKLVALGHNLVRGAAGAAILNAELLMAEGFLD
jgi:aspartate-semialdehyde dehydrogenase